MKLSFICPVINEAANLPESLRNFVSFFQQIPAPIELIWFIDPSFDKSLEIAKKLANEGPHIQSKIPIDVKIFSNTRRLGRGPSLFAAAAQTSGDVLLCNSVDFNVPMGDCFNLLAEIISTTTAGTARTTGTNTGSGLTASGAGSSAKTGADSNIDLVIGNRRTPKKLRRGQQPWARRVFEDIHHEKAIRAGLKFADPTTPVFAIQKKSFEKIDEMMKAEGTVRKIPDWFYMPVILLAAEKLGMKISEIPVNCLDQSESKFRWYKSL